MDRKELLEQLCHTDKGLTRFASRKNSFSSVADKTSTARMLDALSSMEGDVHPTDLCSVLGVTTPRITIILNSMEKEGLIERAVSTEDRRKVVIRLTEKSRELIRERDERNYQFFGKVYDKLGKTGTEMLLKGLEALGEVYQEVYSDMKN